MTTSTTPTPPSFIRPSGNRLGPLPNPNGRTRWYELDHNGFWVNAHEVLPADAVEVAA